MNFVFSQYIITFALKFSPLLRNPPKVQHKPTIPQGLLLTFPIAPILTLHIFLFENPDEFLGAHELLGVPFDYTNSVTHIWLSKDGGRDDAIMVLN